MREDKEASPRPLCGKVFFSTNRDRVFGFRLLNEPLKLSKLFMANSEN